MGSGASAGISVAAAAASETDLKAVLKGLDGEEKKTRKWRESFVISGAMACKDIPQAVELANADAAVQVVEEPRAPLFLVFGAPTGSKQGDGEAPAEMSKDRVFWLAEFESMEAWSGPDHKERESNKTFIEAFNKTMLTGNMIEDMTGSYTGMASHLEKGTPAEDGFAIVVTGKAKDAAAAEELVALNKKHALQQLEDEPNALSYTVYRQAGMMGPLPKDDVTVQWMEVWKSAEDYAAHKGTKHLAENGPKMQALCQDTIAVLEFGKTKRFQKEAKKE